MFYNITMDRKSKVNIESLEISVSYHCNLSCKGCSHCSPLFKIKYFDINKEIDKLKILSKSLNINIIKLIGGEPLLNPQIDLIIKKLKEEYIGKKIYVATNGLLLSKMSNYFWENIDGLEISIYNPKFEESIHKLIVNKFYGKDKTCYIYFYDKFRTPFVKTKVSDNKLVKHIYKNCLFSHDWQCFNYHDGYFFKCPQSWSHSDNFVEVNYDKIGVKVEESNELRKKLNNYINNKEPLFSCYYCLGCVGKLFSIKQMKKDRYKNFIPATYKKQIDYQFLSSLDHNRDVLIGTVYKIIKIKDGKEFVDELYKGI